MVPRLCFLRHAGGSSWWLDVVVVVWVAVDVVATQRFFPSVFTNRRNR